MQNVTLRNAATENLRFFTSIPIQNDQQVIKIHRW